MKHSFKKLTAWLCCMAMLISFIPATALPVFAAETTVTYTEDTDGVLTADDFAATGAVKLTTDTSASALIEVPNGGNWYLDLNGQTLTVSTDTLFEIYGTLTITDLSDGAAGTITSAGHAATNSDGCILVRGTLNLEGGTITGRTTSGTAGAVYVRGTMNMTGGKIIGNTAVKGSAIDINASGTVNISGDAVISDNNATDEGGAIRNFGILNITGGTISGNTAANNDGGAIANRGTLAISGGTITGNSAKVGGAIVNRSALTISGGTISGNTATAAGNGIYNRSGTLSISGDANIDALQIGAATSATIGSLQPGASVTTSVAGALTALDSTVNVNGKVYSYQDIPAKGAIMAGSYKLTGDVTLAGALTVAEGVDATIDLAGNTITADLSVSSTFKIAAGGKLTIKDSVTGGKVQFTNTAASSGGIKNYGTFVLEGGELNGWNRSGAGGFIDMYDGATFKMTGGSITGVSATSYSVIRTQGTTGGMTVEITGGEITGNTSGNSIIQLKGTAAAPNYLTIGGTANISGNTLNGAAFTEEEIRCEYTHITIGGTATVGALCGRGGAEVEGTDGYPYSSIDITGAPTVSNITSNGKAYTPVTITDLTEGASITSTVSVDVDSLDETVAVGTNADGKNVYSYKISTYVVTVEETTGGTVTVDPTEGIDGATVTVTATPDEDYELTAIFVDGTQVATTSPYTLTISGNHTVTATFAKKAATYIEETDGALTADDFAASGMVKLTAATSASELIKVPNGGNWYLDLNGQTLTVSTDTLFEILGSGTLTITDLSDGAAGTITSAGHAATNNDGGILVRGTLNLEGGTITGRTTSGSYAGAVRVRSGATMNMTGGTITGNATTTCGGAIYNEGTVTISNGTISGNDAEEGGAIWNKGTVTISGGTISGNDAKEGGAIWNRTATAKLTISGGTITGNTATASGGAIYNRQDAALTISGGTITGNTAVNGGDVYIHSGTLGISGDAKIDALQIATATSATIGNLQSGAYVKSNAALTIADNDETVYTADNLVYQFVDDVQLGFADKLKPGATVTVEEGDSLGGGIVLTEAGDYILDLAGQTLTGTAAPYFTIGEGVKLTVIDSSEAGTGKIVGLTNATNAMILVNGGSFSLAGGLLTGHTNTNYGGAIYAPTAGSYVAISGGEISGNTAKRGGAISGPNTGSAIDVTIEITGGIVTGNATDRGATMYTQTGATVTIEGGKVGFGTINGEPADVTTSGKEDLWIRNSNFAISGGEIGDVFFIGDAANGYAMAITGNTTIHLLNGVTEETATIGNLVTGARVATVKPKPLTIVEDVETVHVKNNLYRFIDDVGPVTRILFVGNSFAGDTTTYLNDLGNFFNIEVESAYLYIGSQNIRWHAQSLAETLRNVDLNGDGVIGDSRSSKDELYDYAGQENVSIPDAMTDGEWDYVVLQPGVQYVGYEGTYNSDINFLADYIRKVQPTAKILWSQIWAVDNLKYTTTDVDEGTAAEDAYWSMASNYLAQFGGSQAAMYDAILYNTDKFIAGDDARFADVINGWLPIGIAIQEMRNGYTDDSTLESYLATRLTRDGFHLSPNAGRMIAGLTVMKTLFPDQVDLTTMTTEDVTGLFNNDYSNDYRADTFEATDENVTKLLNAVATACGHAADGTVPEYGNGTANKQFNPDAIMANGAKYVAVYEGITEVGQVATDEFYATTGAGKIVVYEDGNAVATIDELWLEENAGIVLTNRYEKLTNKETYYIQADPQAPQLAVIGTTLYMTFDVKLYADEQNTIVNGGIHLISCDTANGDEWTYIGKISDAPMAYGLTALSDGNLLLSVADTATKALTLTTAGEVINTAALCDDIADVAFAEVNNTKGFVAIFALTSNGALYVSTDNGATWTATSVAGGAYASPDLVALGDKDMTVYATWADEAECKIYSKVWTVNAEETSGYGWNDTDAVVAAEYTPATAYNGKASGGQPSAVFVDGVYSGKNAISGTVKTFYTSGNKLQQTEDYTIAVGIARTLTLADCLNIDFKVSKQQIEAMGGTYAKFIRTSLDSGKAVETIVPIEDWKADAVMLSTIPAYQITFAGIAAKEMGDSVWFAVYNDKGEQLTRLDRYSIKTYAMNQLASTSANAKAMHTMLVDMLNYGAAAQTSFGYATDTLVNADLTEAQQALATPKLVKDVDLTTEGYVNTSNGIQCGKSFVLKSSIIMNLSYVAKTLPDNVAYGKISYTNHNNVSDVIDKVPLTDAVVSGSARKEIQITTLKTADVRTLVTVELFDADGNYIEGSKVVYNVATYAYNKYSDAKDGPLSMALMQFGSSAYKYLHK